MSGERIALARSVQRSEEEHAAELANVEVAEHDVLLNITGDSVARSCQVDVDVLPARVNQHVAIIRPDPAALWPRFLRYYLVSPTMQAEMLSLAGAGATRNALTKGMIESFEVPAPVDIDEQRAIAHILGTLDDKIELNRRMNETLEAIAQAIFTSWFVDVKETGLPEGWNESELGDIAEVIDCLHSKKPKRQLSGKPLLQLANIRDDGLIDMTDTYFITEDDYRYWISRMEGSPGDCVITNVGRVAATAQIPEGLRAALGRNMTGVRRRSSFPYPSFLIECLRSSAMKEEVTLKTDTGTILDALNVRNIPKLRFVKPPNAVAARFEVVCRPLRSRMEQNSAESTTLAALRDTLLPKLISGELRVEGLAKRRDNLTIPTHES